MNDRPPGAFQGSAQLLQPGIFDQLRLAWRLMRDQRVPAYKFALPALLTLYLLSPIDAVPDFLLGLGQVDDAGVAIAVILLTARLLPKLAPRGVVDEHLIDMGASPGSGDTSQSQRVIDARFSVQS